MSFQTPLFCCCCCHFGFFSHLPDVANDICTYTWQLNVYSAVIPAKRWQRAWIDIVCGRLCCACLKIWQSSVAPQNMAKFCCASKYGKVLQNMAELLWFEIWQQIFNVQSAELSASEWAAGNGIYMAYIWHIGKKSASDVSSMRYVTPVLYHTYAWYTLMHKTLLVIATNFVTLFTLYHAKHCSKNPVSSVEKKHAHIVCAHKHV